MNTLSFIQIIGFISFIGLIGLLTAITYISLTKPAKAPKDPKGAKLPRLRSDVPIEHKIGWWSSSQNGLSVRNLETNIIFDKLNLFNNTAVIEYKIRGTITNRPQRRPYIKSVHISERWESPYESNTTPTATIIVTPIVTTKTDESYKGEVIKFNIKVQDYLKSGDWGVNQYFVASQTQENRIELYQRK